MNKFKELCKKTATIVTTNRSGRYFVHELHKKVYPT
jgi:hypothetical protein